jgi:hypothetical protein
VAGPIQIGNPVVTAANTSSVIQTNVVSGFTTAGIGALTLNSGSAVTLATVSTLSAPRMVLQTPSITFTPTVNGGTAYTGKLNIGTNDLDVTGSSLSTITGYVATGYNLTGGANWSGPGINSAVAAASSTHLLAIGVIQNNQGTSGQPIYSSTNLFDGAAPQSSDVLVKLTYFGDANLDGKVDGSDYSLIDNGYATDKSNPGALSGWYNGDFNYDGLIDGSDYALIDNAFNNQGGAENISTSALVATSTAQAAGPTAVPEPASIGLIAFTAAALVSRRRRR